ncbi:hypothetical protein Ndes2526B_g03869 [Nannochloris sp. 'desiccata']
MFVPGTTSEMVLTFFAELLRIYCWLLSSSSCLPTMTTPRTAATALSEQDKADIETTKQLPWTPQLLPLAIRRPTLICEQPPAGTPPSEASSFLPESGKDPATPRNQGIVMPTLGAPLCPPLLEQLQSSFNNSIEQPACTLQSVEKQASS